MGHHVVKTYGPGEPRLFIPVAIICLVLLGLFVVFLVSERMGGTHVPGYTEKRLTNYYQTTPRQR